ncbi:MAG: sodium/proton-translocating pyrophosphatase, partial [Bacillota bacterium]|nr:sodium/proton-translocating pyrophosphatase [Bacillota bacterium]
MEGFFTTSTMVWISIGVGVIALLFAMYLAARVKKEQFNHAKMEEISGAIHEGAMAFLASEYKILAIVIIA